MGVELRLAWSSCTCTRAHAKAALAAAPAFCSPASMTVCGSRPLPHPLMQTTRSVYLDLLHPLLTAVNINWLPTLLSLAAFHPLMQRLRQPEEVPGHLHLRLAL